MTHTSRRATLLLILPLLGLNGATTPSRSRTDHPGAALTTVAYRVHRMPEMVAFYSAAFGAQFRAVDARGIQSQFGRLGELTLKFVPIRDSVDFEGFPVHQLGFEVANVGAVVEIARRHGGRVENAPESKDSRVQAAVRDPDGNTIELYGPK